MDLRAFAYLPSRLPFVSVTDGTLTPMATGYLRYPDVHGDLVVFTADDDVWLVPVTGGRASRLTNDHVMVRNPRFSPNGTKIAWTSYLGQRPEVFVIDLTTGNQRRLTWLGAARNLVVGWQDDEHVVFSSPHQTNDVGLAWLYTVSLLSLIHI